MTLNSWKKHRERLNRKHKSLKIKISNLKISIKSKNEAIVTFIQDYQADEYNDFGIKDLLLKKEGKYWKIKKEEWKPMSG